MLKIAAKAPKEVKSITPEERQEDYYKGFRSAVVLAWMFMNFALAAVVLSTAGLERFEVGKEQESAQRSTIYMAVVLWSVAALSAFRFCGAVWFLVVRLVSPHLVIFLSPTFFFSGSNICDHHALFFFFFANISVHQYSSEVFSVAFHDSS